MDPKPRAPKAAPPKGESITFIIAKSIGIEAGLTGVAWVAAAVAFWYF